MRLNVKLSYNAFLATLNIFIVFIKDNEIYVFVKKIYEIPLAWDLEMAKVVQQLALLEIDYQ